MLLRLIAENILSFKDATEFNTFPSSKSHNHDNHKIECGHATVLRMSAIYGANGAGKTNFQIVLAILKTMVTKESLDHLNDYDNRPFKFNSQSTEKPLGIAVEFYNNGNIFYYYVEFNTKQIIREELRLSQNSKDVKLFLRSDANIFIDSEYVGKGINKQFKDVLKRIVRPDMLLLSFLGKYYSDETPIVTSAYEWFTSKLKFVYPEFKTRFVPFLLDKDLSFARLINTILPELKTGINYLKVVKSPLVDEDIKDSTMKVWIKEAKKKPGTPYYYFSQDRKETFNIIYENGLIYVIKLVAVHSNIDGLEVEFPLSNESDGTRRLIEYMPLLYDIMKTDMVYVVDEIERSLHPIMIKEIIRKISESVTAKGQLIFTTHESCLLDQSIFRPDEIWFAQKDIEQATQLYPLSDFNIHKTANIENGYLDGRYGGIPFLSNLKDLNW